MTISGLADPEQRSVAFGAVLEVRMLAAAEFLG
jgi:hypothetical protein